MPGANLPKPPDQRRGRRASVMPERYVPEGGRKGAPPPCPMALGYAGNVWWSWAWRTPQATTWHDGIIMPLARLAQLYDVWADAEPWEKPKLHETILKTEDHYGFTPRSMAALHLFIDPIKADATKDGQEVAVTDIEARRRAREAMGVAAQG